MIRRTCLLAVLVGAALALSACASDDGGGTDSAAASAPSADLAASEDRCASDPVDGFGFDAYGGWKGETRPATGRFTVAEQGGRWWFFTPAGNAFYANGPTGIDSAGDTIGDTDRSPYNEAILARHGSTEAWAAATLDRLCDLGMHNVGGWISVEEVQAWPERIPYTANVDLYRALPAVTTGPPALRPRVDPFVPDAAALLDTALAGSDAERCAADDWCLGTFVENEVPYAPNITAAGSHLDVYLSQPPDAPGKAALQDFFEAEYGGVAAFNDVWGTALADWAQFQQLTSLGDCPPAGGLADEACLIGEPRTRTLDRFAFEAVVAGRVATLADEALDRLNPEILNLGPRLVAGPTTVEVLQAMAAPVDVVSVNDYDAEELVGAMLTPAISTALDEMHVFALDPFERLDDIAEITGKPVFVSEWFYRQARPGMASIPVGLPERPDAESRAAAVEEFVGELLVRPNVVGFAWFQWQDQPIEGRGDGENQLIGIVDVDDDLNQPLADILARLNADIIPTRASPP